MRHVFGKPVTRRLSTQIKPPWANEQDVRLLFRRLWARVLQDVLEVSSGEVVQTLRASGQRNRDAKNRDTKNRDAKHRHAKNRDAKNRGAKKEM